MHNICIIYDIDECIGVIGGWNLNSISSTNLTIEWIEYRVY